jgi:ABC-type sugar transport system substrate-binding protein
MRDGLLELAPDATIVGSFFGGATRDTGYETVRSLLEQGVEFDVILALSDATAFGAIQALEEAGVPPEDVLIFSVNGEPLALQHIRDGHFLRATVELGREAASQMAIDAAIKMLGDGHLPQVLRAPEGIVINRDWVLANQGSAQDN